MTIPTLEAIKQLDTRIFATLTSEEQAVFDYYRTVGRKFDVAVSVVNEADPAALAAATSQHQADVILKSANSRIAVQVGAGAEAAWSARA